LHLPSSFRPPAPPPWLPPSTYLVKLSGNISMNKAKTSRVQPWDSR
jgi:hypothetical protein